ncbi:hypothetical protein ACQKRQ_34240 [Paraburkholderia sp. NPDC080076]|uniref:hypothetical protein n=1 Tax=Paraburkholderia sp. NPDC080076 TaxID=3390605 RepID=UPI003D036550
MVHLQVTWAVLALLLCACTFVSIEGDGNSINDSGGHGGLTVSPAPDQGSVAKRLRTGRGD